MGIIRININIFYLHLKKKDFYRKESGTCMSRQSTQAIIRYCLVLKHSPDGVCWYDYM